MTTATVNGSVALMFSKTRDFRLVTTDRESGLRRAVRVWAVYDKDDGYVYMLAHKSSNWGKNIGRNPNIIITTMPNMEEKYKPALGEVTFAGAAQIINNDKEKNNHAYSLLVMKYGFAKIKHYFSNPDEQVAVRARLL